MNAYIITISNHPESVVASQRCITSSINVGNEFDIKISYAVTPDDLHEYTYEWKYPWSGYDMYNGLRRHGYTTANPKKRISCALSHRNLWEKAADSSVNTLILEHDAIFNHKLDIEDIDPFLIVGINDPRGATRKASLFHERVQAFKNPIEQTPWVDTRIVPQGIAGNSAYIITPEGARRMLALIEEHGLWPNDALMCKQLIPELGTTQKYYTTVQKIRSTTRL